MGRQGEKGFPGKGKKISTKGHEERRRATKGLEEASAKRGREGAPRGWKRLEGVAMGRQGEKGFPGKGKKISTKGHEERRRATKGLEEAREGSAMGRQGEKGFPGKGKKISTKGHEERRRATKGLEEAREGSAMGRQGEKGFPGKGKKISTKGHEERRRATKGLEEAREGSAKGRAGGPRRGSKGLEKTRKGSVKGHQERHLGEIVIHQGARRTRRDTKRLINNCRPD